MITAGQNAKWGLVMIINGIVNVNSKRRQDFHASIFSKFLYLINFQLQDKLMNIGDSVIKRKSRRREK